MKIIVTGGAGFIGSAVIRYIINNTSYDVLNIDKLTYASNLHSLDSVSNNARYAFACVDICNSEKISELIATFKPNAIIHLAAESHVDRSIDGPAEFIQTNIIGTYELLSEATKYWQQLSSDLQNTFCFYHVSTDEVYGDIVEGIKADEQFPYMPSSPYSASKASSDHLVRAWHRTYGLPILISNCSNNYGPYQFPEKLIPLIVLNALSYRDLPIYGDGSQVRDWLYVGDHAQAIITILERGMIGHTYNISGDNEIQNIDVVKQVCGILDDLIPCSREDINSYSDLITFVKDRPGHDKRYALNANKLNATLDWIPKETFKSGLLKTVEWYLENEDWIESVNGREISNQRIGLKSYE